MFVIVSRKNMHSRCSRACKHEQNSSSSQKYVVRYEQNTENAIFGIANGIQAGRKGVVWSWFSSSTLPNSAYVTFMQMDGATARISEWHSSSIICWDTYLARNVQVKTIMMMAFPQPPFSLLKNNPKAAKLLLSV